MFNETVYSNGNFGDALNPGGEPVWFQLGFSNKGAWKAAGSPSAGATVGTPVISLPGAGSGGISPGSPATSSGGGIGDMLSGIPTTYLMIGAAIVLLMVLKK